MFHALWGLQGSAKGASVDPAGRACRPVVHLTSTTLSSPVGMPAGLTWSILVHMLLWSSQQLWWSLVT